MVGLVPARNANAQAVRGASGNGHARARLIAEQGEPTCPTRSELGLQVDRLLGRQAIVEDREDVRVYFSVNRAGGNVIAQFRLVTSDDVAIGVRWVRSAGDVSCSTLRDRFALVLGLMLDIPKTEAEAPTEAPPEPPKEPAPATARWFEFELGVAATAGWQPTPRPGVEAALRYGNSAFLPVALGFVWWPQAKFSSTFGDFALNAWTVTAMAEPPIAGGRWGGVGLGIGGRGGVMRAHGLDFPRNTSSSAVMVDSPSKPIWR